MKPVDIPPDGSDPLLQAAEWYALLQSGQLTRDERQRWTDWLASGPESRAAWERVESLAHRFSLPPQLRDPAGAALTRRTQARTNRRQALKLLLLGSGGGLVAWRAAQTPPLRRGWTALASDHHSAIGQTREITLVDGSRLWLASDSAVDVNYDTDRRALLLRRGEILVQTTADYSPSTSRPFTVHTAHGAMRALGTRFSVRAGDDDASRGDPTQLDVFEGRVAVRLHGDPGTERLIDAGRQLRFDSRTVLADADADPAREAWTRGVLLAREQPLDEFLRELARYRHGPLTCDPAVARLSVVGGFPLHDTDRALALLEAALPVRVQRRFGWWSTVQAR